MSLPSITQQLRILPDRPGVYLFRNEKKEILYVGKAKVLKNRVRSYFQPGALLEPAKEQMVPKVVTIETIACDTEHEALILEANLIRQHRPPYNVVLTDDKYYLFIKVTKEEFPRVYPVRRIAADGSRYFGPYSSASAVRRTLKLLRRLFPHFGESVKEKTWFFPHPLFSGNTAPASPQATSVGRPPIDSERYHENIQHVVSFLEGKRDAIRMRLTEGMRVAAREKSYEQAALFRDQLHAIERLEGSQKVYLPKKESFDVISIVTRKSASAANVFSVRDGKLLQKNTFLLKHRSSAPLPDVLRQFVLQYYRVAQDIPKVILIPCPLPDQNAIADWINQTTPPVFLMPQRGKKRQLVTMGELNAQQLLTAEEVDFESKQRLERALQELAQAIGSTQPLHRIETYDISNIQGSLATGSMVVFIDGQPSKQQYKKFRLRAPQSPSEARSTDRAKLGPSQYWQGSPNDYAMLQQVLQRRFSNRHPDWPLPDLIIIDGGKGQLSAAQSILKTLQLNVPMTALAKREEELFIPGRAASIRLPFDSDALYLVQRMRDEAHRFTVTYHRLLRSKRAARSILDDIPGIGPRLKKKLLTQFGSVKGIRAADDQAIVAVLGPAKAKVLREYL